MPSSDECLQQDSEFQDLSEERLREHLKFEMLLSEISARFVNLEPEQVHSEIEEAQRRVCDCLRFDRSVLWQVADSEQGAVRLTHLYRPPSGTPIIEPEDPSRLSDNQWALQSPEPLPAFIHIRRKAMGNPTNRGDFGWGLRSGGDPPGELSTEENFNIDRVTPYVIIAQVNKKVATRDLLFTCSVSNIFSKNRIK